MGPNLSITIQSDNEEYTVVKFDGDFDKAGHNEVKETLSKCFKEFVGKYLVFDFNNLRFINSEGIGYLMEVHTHLAQNDQKLVIIGLNAHVADVFETIGIAEIVSIYPTMNDFLNTL